MTPECEHTFRTHYGVRVFNGTGLAWVQWEMFAPPTPDAALMPQMLVCIHCGEQGYEVPA